MSPLESGAEAGRLGQCSTANPYVGEEEEREHPWLHRSIEWHAWLSGWREGVRTRKRAVAVAVVWSNWHMHVEPMRPPFRSFGPAPRPHPFNLAEWVGGGHALIIDDPEPPGSPGQRAINEFLELGSMTRDEVESALGDVEGFSMPLLLQRSIPLIRPHAERGHLHTDGGSEPKSWQQCPRDDANAPARLIAWVWYHRTMDAEDRHGRRPGWGRTMNAARAYIYPCWQPFEAIDVAERSHIEAWTAERLESEMPGYTEFAKRADANMPHNRPAPAPFDIGAF